MHRTLLSKPWHFKANLLIDIVTRSCTTQTAKRGRRKKESTLAADNEPVTKSKKPCISQEMEKYFQSHGGGKLLKKLPPSLLKRDSQETEKLYLATGESAKVIGEHVTAGLLPEMLLAEVNPGPGLLTRELLQRKVKKMLLLESDNHFQSNLQKIIAPSGISANEKEVQLRLSNFNNQWYQGFLDCKDRGSRVQNMFEGLPRKRWKEDINFRLFSIIGSIKFFKTLLNSVAHQRGLFALGRCEMYLVVPPLLYAHLTCSKEAGYKLYRTNSVLFQLFFEHEFLAKIPRRNILPWPTSNVKRKNRTQHWQLGLVDAEDWYLVRLVPRRDLFDYCLPDNLKLLMFFVTQNLVSRTNRVIPALERWIPYCGARLILNKNYTSTATDQLPTGKSDHIPSFLQHKSLPLRHMDLPERINIFTEFGELTPSQILTVFNEFISWPEFRQSPFLQTMEQYYSKQRLSSVDTHVDADSIDNDEEDDVDGLEDDDDALEREATEKVGKKGL